MNNSTLIRQILVLKQYFSMVILNVTMEKPYPGKSVPKPGN